MANESEPQIQVEPETYEGKAIAAYLRNQITAPDLCVSLGVSRGHMYRLINRYREAGEEGLLSKKGRYPQSSAGRN